MPGCEEYSNRMQEDIKSGSSIKSGDESDFTTLCQSGSIAADIEPDDSEQSAKKIKLSTIADLSQSPVKRATQEKGINLIVI